MSNPFLLAADNSPELLPLLRANPSLASSQDDHGYSLIHAAVSYNHLDLLRTLVNEFKVNVDIRDEDNETALFVAETVEAARALVEEFGADPKITGDEGRTAAQSIQADDDFPEVVAYLASFSDGGSTTQANGSSTDAPLAPVIGQAPPLPAGISIDMGTMAPEDIGENEVDQEFRRKIEELAAREDFQDEAGQAELRALVTEAFRGQVNPADRDSINSDEGPGIFDMVQSLEVAGKLFGNPDKEKENQDFVAAASTADTKVLCAQDEDMKPFQVIFTRA
ncbi:hypothetical protein GMDG_00428 [Pseudogymnoascus destructans 20631-21]|uniref:Uncharacterized protein n=1 Tax=Pseudogymnoascus destructans (strain ATCC MYA-4855 / 20631-21) TaxID=658429 RepID=L8G3T5_PSED2|nr:hypothetical protein GMDG_00428 [Pseudogymnoascus destructans 20631-21]